MLQEFNIAWTWGRTFRYAGYLKKKERKLENYLEYPDTFYSFVQHIPGPFIFHLGILRPPMLLPFQILTIKAFLLFFFLVVVVFIILLVEFLRESLSIGVPPAGPGGGVGGCGDEWETKIMRRSDELKVKVSGSGFWEVKLRLRKEVEEGDGFCLVMMWEWKEKTILHYFALCTSICHVLLIFSTEV